ncbi:MAG: STAS domain-containing protein [Verrucomicrobiales bacterium]|nr:STAS domain-containing protein [Verrucomicrobiales bacterium]
MKNSAPTSAIFRPKLLETLRGYSRADWAADLPAGITVGIIALSLSMALGIASERPPSVGIVTAIIAGFLISALGGSRVQIGGPTAAFIPVVLGVAHDHGFGNLVVCTALAGVMLIAMGFARLGGMIKYIPMPVVAGFTAGIAVYIFSTQIRDFLGIRLGEGVRVPAEFLGKLSFFGRHLGEVHWPSAMLALGSVFLLKQWPPGWSRRLPPSLVAVVAGTLLVALLPMESGISTLGSRFGPDAIPRTLPMPEWPPLDWAALRFLIQPAFTIALLAAIESLLCAVVADGMIEDRHDPNTELIAQGLANLGSAAFGGLPATGAIARTAANIRSGGRTPVAGMVHSATILGIVLVAAPLARFVPLPVLSGVLVVVALNMGEWRNFVRLRSWPRSDRVVFLLTFVLTILTDITVAVEVGMILAAVLFIKRVSETTQITSVDERVSDLGPGDSMHGRQVPEGVLVFQVAGAFLFGAADKLEAALQGADRQPTVLILGMKRVMAMDATGLHRLEELHRKLRRHHRWLILAGPHTQPLMTLSNAGFLHEVGFANVCENLDQALARAADLVGTARSASGLGGKL